MNIEQRTYISALNNAPRGELYIKRTGREGVNLPPHAHEKHQIIYTVSGTLHVQTGNMSYFVPEQHLMWIPARAVHELSSNNRQIELVVFYIDALPDVENDVIRECAIYSLNAFLLENLRYIISLGKVLTKKEQADVYNFVMGFFRLLPTVGRSTALPLQSLYLPSNKRLLPVMRYISTHLCDNLTIERVAAEFGFSVRTLSRMFSNEHLRFSSYVNYQRITRAIELIAARDKTLQEIAYEVGFNTPNNFTRVFKHLMGVSPSTFCKGTRVTEV